jgi:hypothetical protein
VRNIYSLFDFIMGGLLSSNLIIVLLSCYSGCLIKRFFIKRFIKRFVTVGVSLSRLCKKNNYLTSVVESGFFTLYIKVICMNFYYVDSVGYCYFGVFFAFSNKITI